MTEEKDNVSDVLVWVDLETTGFKSDPEVLLEIAVIVTDNELNELGHYSSVIVDYDPDKFVPDDQEKTEDDQLLVWKNHWDSGLIDDIKAVCDDSDQIPTLEVVQNHIIDLLNAHGVTEDTERRKRPPICGSTVAAFDRPRLKKHLPDFHALCHYRSIDVSSILELQKRWAPDLEVPEKNASHRAPDDIRSSIAYLKNYRARGFVGL